MNVKELVGMTVFAIDGGVNVGTVDRLFFSPEEMRITDLVVSRGTAVLEDPEPQRVLPTDRIKAVGRDAITIEAEDGTSVMQAAVSNGINEIVAECGGACTCATCHVYVDDAWTETVGGPSMMEEDMLDFAFDVKASSRLSCQIKVKDELDGLVVHVPSRQG